jgi:HSP20 family protein
LQVEEAAQESRPAHAEIFALLAVVAQDDFLLNRRRYAHLFLAAAVRRTAARPAAMPMDAYRQGDNFYICLDLPGIDPGSIDLTVEQNVLTVRAERAPVQPDGAQMIVAERPYGTFTRQVFLGETLDTDSIAADYAAGVLTLTIPVHEAAKPRNIQVTSNDTKQAVTA